MRAPHASDAEADGMAGILLDQADRLFGQHVATATLAAADAGTWPDALWAALEEAGLPLALVPEEAGGVGLASADVALLIRRSAYHTAPVPLGETIVANALWAEAGGTPATGVVTLAPTNDRDEIVLTLAPDGSGTLQGIATRVPWGAQAGHVLVHARTESGTPYLCRVEGGGVSVETVRNLAYEPRDTLRFEALGLPREAIRPAGACTCEVWLARGAALRAEQLIGGMERALDYAVAYANERVQFGRPLAKFQAIQHMLAVAAGQIAVSTAAADARAEAGTGPGLVFAAAIAKARSGEAAGQIAAICHQVHGAMGFTQEHPLHYVTRRLWSWRDEFGSESFWQARIGRLACRHGGEQLWPLVTGELAV